MSKFTTTQIRNTFIDYFVKNNHTYVPASSLVPQNDPTLMFTNSGMVQFKDVFTGIDKKKKQKQKPNKTKQTKPKKLSADKYNQKENKQIHACRRLRR